MLGAIAVGALGLAAFVFVESRVAFPLLPLHFFRRRNFTTSMLAALFSGGAYMGGFILAPLLLQSVFAFSLSTTSLVMLARPAAFSASSPVGGSLASKYGERPIAIIGAISIATALVLLGTSATTEIIALVVVALLIQGIGNGFSQPPITAVMSNSVDETDLGVAAAAQRMTFQVGTAMGITIMTAVYGGTEQAADFRTAYLVGAGLGLLALLFSSMMRSTPPDAEPDTEGAAERLEHDPLPATAVD